LERNLWFKLVLILFTLQISCKEGKRASSSAALSISLVSSNVIDYNSSFVEIRLQGLISGSDFIGLDILSVHSNSTCSDPVMGTSVANEFISSGLNIQVPVNTTVDLYVKSQALNNCIFLESYTHPLLAPTDPVFVSVSPMSPSRVTSAPGFFGMALPMSSTVEFFSDAFCTELLANGSSSQFGQAGISVQLPLNATTSVYARTLDPLGTYSNCVFMSDFTHSNANSPFPELLEITPLSPSKTSFTPTVRGTTSVGAVSVALYSDSGCMNVLAQGNPSDFENVGFNVTLNPNSTNVIYARSIDNLGQPSVCALFTTYTHDNLPPANLTYLNAVPVSPTNQTTLPKIIGFASSDTDEIVFYDSDLCINTVGFGIRSDYITTGSVANVKTNDVTQIYGKAFDSSGNGSNCVFLTSYTHNTQAPSSPVFGSLSPASPTNLTTTPHIAGLVADRTTHLNFFKDEMCVDAIGDGSVFDYENSGIIINADANATTSIYVQVRDFEGNISDCFFHASYAHSSTPSPDPVFSLTVPASPSRSSHTPAVLGTADSSIATVKIFSDSSCLTQIASATRGQFTASGVATNLPLNSTNDLYARATDVYGNDSSCVFLTTYIHNNIPPLNPSYTSNSPLSPNNQSATPTIYGSSLYNPASQLPPLRVDFFDSNSCVSKLGEGSPDEYENSGITINVAVNAQTTIYAKTFDAAGNESDCTFQTDYTYNNLVPAAPFYSSAVPASPSYSQNVKLFGTYGPSSDFMNRVSLSIYSDSMCTSLVSSSNPSLLTTSGVPIIVNPNSTMSLYGQTINEVGTLSSCHFLTNYTHRDLPPANLTAFSNINGSVYLNWTPDGFASPTAKYTIERALNSNGPFTILNSNQVGNTYTDQLASNNTEYFYRVYATNNTGRSQYSSVVSITVSAPNPITSNNLVTSIGDSQVNLSWSGFPQNVTYKIFRSIQFAGPFTDLGVSTTSTIYVDTGVTNGQTYYYYIKATNAAGESIQSNIASAVPKFVPSAPTQFMLTPLYSSAACSGAKAVRLSWTASSYFDQFNIYAGYYKNSLSNVGSTGIPNFDDCGIGTDNLLYYRIVSSWGSANSNGSNRVGFYSSDSPAFLVSAEQNNINLTWSAPITFSPYSSGDLKYTIYKSLDPDKNFTSIADAYSSTNYNDPITNGAGAYYYIQAYLIDVDGDKVFVGYPTQIKSAQAFTNPTAPTNLTLNYIESESRVQLDWISPNHFNNFKIYRSNLLAGPYSLVQSTSNLFVSSAPLVSGMNYFKITASWGGYETSPTNIVSFRNAPISGLGLTPQADQLSLIWSSVSGVQDYIISRANSINGPFVDYDVSLTASYSDLAVSNNTGYYYQVRARFPDFTQGQKSTVVFGQITTSTVPSNISLTVLGDTFVRADWPGVTGAVSYRVERALNIAGPYTIVGSTAAKFMNIYGLTPQSQYFVRVIATVAGVPYTSPIESVWTFVPTTAPIGIVGNNQIDLSWSPMSGNVNYDIERSTDGISYTTISTNYSMTNYTDSSVINGNIYFYRIKANYIPLSLTSLASVGLSPGRTPIAPSDLNVENNGTGSTVTLTWADVTGRTGFNIYRSTSSGVYGAPIQSSGTADGTSVSGLTAGTVYYFRVTALNGKNESAPSNEVSIIPSSNNIKPIAQYNSSTSISISWSSVVGADHYSLLRSRDGITFEQITSNLLTTSYIDSAITPALTYYYRYQPYNSSNIEMSLSFVSDPVNVSVKPQTPIGFVLASASTSSVDLFWPRVPSILSYEILRSQTQGGPYTLLASPTFNDITYTDNTVTPGQSYFYVLRTVNSSGVRSNNSNEVGVDLVSGPLNLLALNTTTGIDLSWNSLGGVSGYEVLRSLLPTGPFGLVQSTSSLVASDTNVIAAETYYYVVRGVYANGRRTVQSNVFSIVRDGSLKFQVPIELTDTSIASSGLINLAFERTLTSFNTNDYDGVTSYEMEIIATNFDTVTRSVGIVNESNTIIDYVTVPANTIEPTLIKGTINMIAGAHKLRLELEQTNSDGELSVLSAKLLVNQVNATKTRIYYPLLGSDELPSNMDKEVYAYATSQTIYHDFVNASYFSRRTTKLNKIENYNAWELETLVSTDGGAEGLVALQNINTSQLVPMTETRFSASNISMATIPINEGVTQFKSTNEGHDYRLVIKCEYYCSSGSVRVHKAGLWVKLHNLTQTSIVYRIGSLKRLISSPTNIVAHRATFDRNLFTQSKVYFQIIADTDTLSQGSANLIYHSANSGNAGLNTMAGTLVYINPASSLIYRSSEIVGMPLNEKYMSYVDPSQGQITVRSSQLLIETGP
jgi:fibronectin type 3 domain-containing protein